MLIMWKIFIHTNYTYKMIWLFKIWQPIGKVVYTFRNWPLCSQELKTSIPFLLINVPTKASFGYLSFIFSCDTVLFNLVVHFKGQLSYGQLAPTTHRPHRHFHPSLVIKIVNLIYKHLLFISWTYCAMLSPLFLSKEMKLVSSAVFRSL